MLEYFAIRRSVKSIAERSSCSALAYNEHAQERLALHFRHRSSFRRYAKKEHLPWCLLKFMLDRHVVCDAISRKEPQATIENPCAMGKDLTTERLLCSEL